MMSILSVKNLSVKLQQKEILRGISLDFAEAKRTAIIGPNGCGKSTLLRALSGLNRKYEGEVLLAGQKLSSFSKKSLARQLAILPQGATAPTDLTVGELVDYGRFPHRSWFKADVRADREAVAWAMAQTKIKPLKDRLVATLSGGERQRAWIAMALAQQPKILLLDEPTTYLDIAHQLEVMQIVKKLNSENKITVIMVLHDINHARQYADEIVVLKEQQVFAQGTAAAVLTPALLATVFGVRVERFVSPAGAEILLPTSLVDEGGAR